MYSYIYRGLFPMVFCKETIDIAYVNSLCLLNTSFYLEIDNLY